MSRAEPLPARERGVGLAGSLRAAAIDFYYGSIRFVAANVAWGFALLAVLIASLAGGPLATLVAAPFLAIPYAGVVRLATLTVRGRDVVVSDAWRAYRDVGVVALLVGAATTLATAILASNVVVGVAAGGLAGWAFATLAASGLLAIWVVGFPVWTLLLDPERAARPVRERLRIAVLLVVAAPGRCTALALVLAAVLAVSTIAFAALLTISVAFAALAAARYLLPLSDRLETWLQARTGERRIGG